MAQFQPMRFTKRTLTVVALVWCIPQWAVAEVYRWVDANGNVHFSDQARPGAEQITVPPTSTISLPQASGETEIGGPEEEIEQQITYKTLAIEFPEHHSAFHSGNGTFTVTTNLEPQLAAIHELQLLLDGKVYASGQSGQFLLSNVDRGTHNLQLQITHRGQVIQTGPVVEFTLHRPSLLNPNRQNTRP